MAVRNPDNRETVEPRPSTKPAAPRVWIGVLAAFLLYRSVFAVGSGLAIIFGRRYGLAEFFSSSSSSFAWLLVWSGSAIFVWRRAKPQLMEWAAPFALFVGLPYYAVFDTRYDLSPNRPTGLTITQFALGLILVGGAIWGPTIGVDALPEYWAKVRSRKKRSSGL